MSELVCTEVSDGESSAGNTTSSAFAEAIGIDIGTSWCTVAIWNGSEVKILKNTRDKKSSRSFVTIEDGKLRSGVTIGLSLEDKMHSGAAVFNFKRLFGRADTDPVVHASKSLPYCVQALGIGSEPFIALPANDTWRPTSPEEALGTVLLELKLMAEAKLNQKVKKVVLSVPVSFSRYQLTRVVIACAVAGLRVIRFMPEPTAVAHLYALQELQETTHEKAGSSSEKIVLIINFGAGYCDVAVTAISGGKSHTKALSGSAIGCEDLLQNMMRYLLPEYDDLFSSLDIVKIRAMALLRMATHDAIHRLSTYSSAEVNVDLENGLRVVKTLGRPEFEDVNHEVFEKCESLMVKCLGDAKVEAKDLSDVILVGGGSRIPKVRDLVERVCQTDDLYKGISFHEGVAIGLALEALVASGGVHPSGNLRSIQATSSSVGIRADNNSYVPIIPHSTTIPVVKTGFFTTSHDDQREALIAVYEGEESRLEENQFLGVFKLTGIPPAPRGGPLIKVRMHIDAANVLKVGAALATAGTALPMEVRMPRASYAAAAFNNTYGSTLDLVSTTIPMASSAANPDSS